MATFKEICESVFDEANGRPITLSSVNLGKDTDGTYHLTDPMQRRVVSWVNSLYIGIQQQMPQASFMHKRGTFLTLASSTETYTKSNIRAVDNNSLYMIKSGETARLPIIVREYDEWVQDERSSDQETSTPLWLIRQPDDKWRPDPIPNATFTVYGDWWLEPAGFSCAIEEPLWDSAFHDILKWKALGLWAAEYGQEGAGPILRDRIAQFLPPLEKAFFFRYSRKLKGPATFM